MRGDRDPLRGFKRYLAIAVCAVYLGFTIPANIAAERRGVADEGVIVRYQPSYSGRYFYPIVEVTSNGRTTDFKSVRSWRWKWYDPGERVPVLLVSGRECYVGSVLLRWDDDLLALGALTLLTIWAVKRRPTT
jgi:hypothetical protein